MRFVVSSAVAFLCNGTDISGAVTPIGVKFCTVVHICPGLLDTFSPYLGRYVQGVRKSPIFSLQTSEYLENGKSQRYTRQLELNTSLTRAF